MTTVSEMLDLAEAIVSGKECPTTPHDGHIYSWNRRSNTVAIFSLIHRFPTFIGDVEDGDIIWYEAADLYLADKGPFVAKDVMDPEIAIELIRAYGL